MRPERPTVAIVEDNPGVRKTVAIMLRMKHFLTEEFASAEEFLLSPMHRTASCLVSDIELPGMNGFHLYLSLRGCGLSCPTLFMSGNPAIELPQHDEQGAVHFLRKPFRADALIAAVTALCIDSLQRSSETLASQP